MFLALLHTTLITQSVNENSLQCSPWKPYSTVDETRTN